MIVLMAGLPATGKSTLARELARRTSGRVLSKDEVRHALFLPAEIEYSTRQDDFCLQVMLETTGYLVARNPGHKIFRRASVFAAISDRKCIDRSGFPAAAVAHSGMHLLRRNRKTEACSGREDWQSSCWQSQLPALSRGQGAVRNDHAFQDRD